MRRGQRVQVHVQVEVRVKVEGTAGQTKWNVSTSSMRPSPLVQPIVFTTSGIRRELLHPTLASDAPDCRESDTDGDEDEDGERKQPASPHPDPEASTARTHER